MQNLFVIAQYVGIILLMIEIGIVLTHKPSVLQRMALIIEVATLINYVGYLLELQATNLELVLSAVKIIYIGKPFIILVTFLFIMEFYKVKIPQKIKLSLCLFHASIPLFVLTCRHHNLFYTSYDFVEDGWFPHMVVGHGIIYYMFMAVLVVYFITIFYVTAKRYKTLVTLGQKQCAIYILVIIIMCGLGLITYSVGVTGGYDLTVICYLLGTFIFFYCIIRYDLLDSVSMVKDVISDEMEQAVIVVDVNDEVVYYNKQFGKIFDCVDGAVEYELIKSIKAHSDNNEKYSRNGRILTVAKKKLEQKGIPYGDLYIFSDITELEKHAIEMERQKIIAEVANKAKSDFLARMSHEIRTPINAVIGMNEMILRESNQDDVKGYAMDVKSASNTLLSIINDILDTSKIESGKLEIIPVEYELDSLLNDIINAIQLKAKQKELEFNVEVDQSIPNRLLGDDIRIRQIIINILNNAVKYTDKGSITFSIKGRRDGKNEIISCSVADTGRGIKEEDMPKLFKSFERIEIEKNRNIEGTGLGMSIVVDLLKLMDGELKVDSVYGEGTTFSFEIMQGIIKDEPIGDYRERIRNANKDYKFEKNLYAPDAKILIVDDNKINRSVFKNLIKHTKIQVTDVDSGMKCLEEVVNNRYDIIFLDHMMPELDGVETLRRMKLLEVNKCENTPVVALTANAVSGAKEMYMANGFDAFLSKPIEASKLEQMIIELLPDELLEDGQAQE